jgi:hypothetical protein
MALNTDRSVKRLDAALDRWKLANSANEIDLLKIFRTDRKLFLDLAKTKVRKRDTKLYPRIASLSELARRTVSLSPKPGRNLQSEDRSVKIFIKDFAADTKKGNMPTGKTWLFHGIPMKEKTFLRHTPELGKDYNVVVHSLKTFPATRAELKKRTGIPESRLKPILKRLTAKRMVKKMRSKTKTRVFFAPHR